MKAQVAFESFVTIAVLIAFTVPIILLILFFSSFKLEDLSLFHGKSTLQYLSDNINKIYLEGNGAKRTLLIDLPSNTQELIFSNNKITLILSTSNGVYEVSEPVFANIKDVSIYDKSGQVFLIIKMNDSTVEVDVQ